jgi:putative thioredoxin
MDVDEATFQREVVERSSEQAVVVDFWAEWCGPCKQLTPVLEQAVEGRDVLLVKVDVDANQHLAQEYGIRGIPAVKAFRNGQIVAEFVGARSRASVDSFLDELTKAPLAETLDDGEVARALRAGEYEQAFELLYERAQDPERREEARRVMVDLFGELGQDHPLATQYRRRLAALLY